MLTQRGGMKSREVLAQLTGWLTRAWSLFKYDWDVKDLMVAYNSDDDGLMWRGVLLEVGHEGITVDDACSINSDDDVAPDYDPSIVNSHLLISTL